MISKRFEKRCTISGYERLAEAQYYALLHFFRWGADGYPLRKLGRNWFVDGHCGYGVCPSPFKTKREAVAAWEATIDLIIAYKSGRMENPAL